MKKVPFICFVLLIPLFVYSQAITVTTSDMPSTGDTIRISTALTTGGIDYTLTGTNYTWDFTGLTPVSQDVDTFITVSSAGLGYSLAFFTAANQALKQGNIDLVIVQLQNVFNFYKNASSAYSLAGYGATFSGLPIPVKYDVADRLYKFPLNYGNIDSTQSNFSMSLTATGYFAENKKRKNSVDGWGTLKTPYGIFQVLRVKSEILQKDTIHIDTLGVSLPSITQNIVEYKWIAKGKKIPVLEITKSSLIPTATIRYIDSLRTNLIFGLNEIESASLNIYPNPASGNIFIELPLTVQHNGIIQILDVTGRIVTQQNIQSGEPVLILSIDNYPSGFYFVQIESQSKQIMKGKFIVTH